MGSPPVRSHRLRQLRRVLAHFWVRLGLSVCIIISLLPFAWSRQLDSVFLLLFGFEFGARVLLILRGYWDEDDDAWDEQTHDRLVWPPPGRILALTLDFLALLSFLPLPVDQNTRLLRVFRLSRMLLLVGYWAPLVRDLWSVMVRRERARQVILMGAVVAGLSFAGTVVLENLAEVGAPIDFSGDGVVDKRDRGFLVHLWWSFRQIQDPGNMVQDTHSVVAVLVSFALTVAGLLLVSFLIGLGTDVVRELLEISRLRAPGFSGHTVVVNVTPSTRPLLRELMGYYRKLLPDGRLSFGWVREFLSNARSRVRGPRYVVVGHSPEPPDFLRHDELSRLVYREGSRDPGEFARRADVNSAQRVVLLADLDSPDPDADTIHGILTLVESMRLEAMTRGRDDGRVRLLIAEILDESNVMAARAAIAAAGEHTRCFVVPTERLIALFIACVAVQPGAGRVLEELLTSRGHEIYTCFFDLSGLGYSRGQAPELPGTKRACLDHLREQAAANPAQRHVVPLGTIVDTASNEEEFAVRLNSPQLAEPEAAKVRGFVALAPNFSTVREFADRLYTPHKKIKALEPLTGPMAPRFVAETPKPMRRVLIGGFRSATVGLVESLLMGCPELEILILVASEEQRLQVFDDFDAHNGLQERGLMKGVHARFPRRGETGLGFVREKDEGRTRVRVATGDQGSTRLLMELPEGFGHLGDIDSVILISGENEQSDARTTKTLMKIEALLEAAGIEQRVVAEVLDADLAQRLRRHYLELGRGDVLVYSIQELRSYFMFQSVVVPSFDLVYGELMGSWGQSFNRLLVEGEAKGTCDFAQLEAQLANERNELLLACEFEDEQGELVLRVGAHGSDGRGKVELFRLRAVWTVANDSANHPGRDAEASGVTIRPPA